MNFLFKLWLGDIMNESNVMLYYHKDIIYTDFSTSTLEKFFLNCQQHNK